MISMLPTHLKANAASSRLSGESVARRTRAWGPKLEAEETITFCY
jgi:hypothetical protein